MKNNLLSKLRLNDRLNINSSEFAVITTILIGGSFSYYQIGSRLFACGRVLAGAEIYYWLILSGIQALLFVGSALSERVKQVYRLIQYLLIPLVGFLIGNICCIPINICLTYVHCRSILVLNMDN